MQCLHCGNPESRVTNSAKHKDTVYRERTCQLCRKRFYTMESSPKLSQSFLRHQLIESRQINKELRKERQ